LLHRGSSAKKILEYLTNWIQIIQVILLLFNKESIVIFLYTLGRRKIICKEARRI
jgi:cell shape-determining protein MreD